MRSFEDSCQRLGTSRIDILYIHDLDLIRQGERSARHRFREVMEGYRALDELRRDGVVKAIGLGVNDANRAVASIAVDAMPSSRGALHAARTDALELLDKVRTHGASIVLGGPFNSGLLVGRGDWNYKPAPHPVIARATRLREICDIHGVPLGAAALQFPLAHPAVATVIPGPRSGAELDQIVSWFTLRIPDALWSDMTASGLIRTEAPIPHLASLVSVHKRQRFDFID